MNKKKYLAGLVLMLSASLLVLLGFSYYKPDNLRNNPSISYAINDSTRTGSDGPMMKGYMTHRRMMSGAMMESGMMSRGMMKRNISNSNGINNWVAPSSADDLTNPLKDIVKASREGKSIFDDQCITCHGNDVAVNGPVDLTSSTVQNQSDGAIFWKMTNGKGSMPSFRQTLTKDQRWSLVDYIRTLAGAAPVK